MVKMDSGMSRNGCQCEELDSIMDVSLFYHSKDQTWGNLSIILGCCFLVFYLNHVFDIH